jgi:hypothetical protein
MAQMYYNLGKIMAVKQVDSINLEADSGRLSIPSLLGLIKFVHLLIAVLSLQVSYNREKALKHGGGIWLLHVQPKKQ